jgi:antitoxin (DNA-binding transcriptional repressor) of toxin-antitoxin stability system
MDIIDIPTAEAQLETLIERVLCGEEVIIGRAGKAVARLVKYEPSEAVRRPGALAGRITITDDFDELPDDIAEAVGARSHRAQQLDRQLKTAYSKDRDESAERAAEWEPDDPAIDE